MRLWDWQYTRKGRGGPANRGGSRVIRPARSGGGNSSGGGLRGLLGCRSIALPAALTASLLTLSLLTAAAACHPAKTAPVESPRPLQTARQAAP